MSEKRNYTPVEAIQATSLFVYYSLHSLKYNLQISPEKHNEAMLNSKEFLTNFLEFLSDDTFTKLAPLNLSSLQASMLKFLTTSANQNELKLADVRKFNNQTFGPLLLMNHNAIDKQIGLGTGLVSSHPINHKVHNLWLFGVNRDGTMPPLIFMVFPKKPETAKQILASFNEAMTTNLEKQKVDFLNKGQRIVVEEEGYIGWQKFERSVHFFLIGRSEGPKNTENFWVYGANLSLHKKTQIKQGLKSLSFSLEKGLG